MAICSLNTFASWCCLLAAFVTGESGNTLDSSWEQQQHDLHGMLRKQLDFPYEDSSFFTFSDMEKIVGGNMTPPFVVSDTCKAYLLAYSSNASDFVHCAIRYARPFRFCGSCVVPYTKAINLYCDIVKKGDGTCNRQLLNSDRIHLLTQTNAYMQTLWETSDCDSCFSSVVEHEDGSVDFEIENKTMIFLELYNETGTCMNVTDQELEDFTHWANGSNSSVCKECEDSYRRLNQHFNSILKISQNHVCMDVVDIDGFPPLFYLVLPH
ncbi:osteopetrosis-associated transmembrane protein 1-like isoform X2 [Liolophura sinensis]|uniref:osteopetrosis-associated transmembrane protein 1-like isoform X2 n=1 Tax=Liolophura sinensis TaxID=3198878 RepID=UPI003158E31C